MRLDAPFVRLPFVVDAAALDAEVAALAPELWRAHPEGAPGNTAVPLVAYRGDPGRRPRQGRDGPDAAPRAAAVRAPGARRARLGDRPHAAHAHRGGRRAHLAHRHQLLLARPPPGALPGAHHARRALRVRRRAGPHGRGRGLGVRHLASAPGREPVAHARASISSSTPSAARVCGDRIDHPDAEPTRRRGRRSGARARHRAREPAVGDDARGSSSTPSTCSCASSTVSIRTVASALDEPVARARARVAFGVGPLRRRRRRPASTSPRCATRPTRVSRSPRAPSRLPERCARDRGRCASTRSAPRSIPTDDPPTAGAARRRRRRRARGHRASTARCSSCRRRARAARCCSRRWRRARGPLHDRRREPPRDRVGRRACTRAIATGRRTASRRPTPRPPIADALRRGFAEQLRDRDEQPARRGRGAHAREDAEELAARAVPRRPRSPTRASSTCTATRARRVSSMLDAWRSGRFVTYPDLPGWGGPPWSLLLVPGLARPGRPTAGRGRHRRSGRPRPRCCSTTSSSSTPTGGASPATTRSSRDRAGRDGAPRRVLRASSGTSRSKPTAPAVAPHARLARPGEVAAQRRRARAALRPRARGRRARARRCSRRRRRIKPVAPSRRRPRRRAPRAGATPAASADGAADVRQRAHGGVPRAARRSSARRCWCRRTRAAASSSCAPTADGLNTHFRLLPDARWAWPPRPGAARARDQGAGAGASRTSPRCAPRARAGRPARRLLRAALAATSPATSASTSWPGPATSCGSVNTRFSCLCTLDRDYSFVPRWRPPFVTALAAEDRCHLNGLAVVDGRPRYVTALGETDTAERLAREQGDRRRAARRPVGRGGRRRPVACRTRRAGTTAGSGCSSRATARSAHVDLETGRVEDGRPGARLHPRPAFVGPYAFVGLSQVRESRLRAASRSAEGVERSVRRLGRRPAQRRRPSAFLRFEGIVQEIYEVLALPGIRYPEILEPDRRAARHLVRAARRRPRRRGGAVRLNSLDSVLEGGAVERGSRERDRRRPPAAQPGRAACRRARPASPGRRRRAHRRVRGTGRHRGDRGAGRAARGCRRPDVHRVEHGRRRCEHPAPGDPRRQRQRG